MNYGVNIAGPCGAEKPYSLCSEVPYRVAILYRFARHNSRKADNNFLCG